MIIKINLDPDTLKKIREAVVSGGFLNEHDFVRMAINNQLEDVPENLFKDISESPDSEESEKIGFKKLDHEQLKQFSEKKILENKESSISLPIQHMLYGPSAAGLIWFFHNRFLPVKFVIYELARTMFEEKSHWIYLNQFKESVSDIAVEFSDKLETINVKNNDLKLTTGFPVSYTKLQTRHGNRKLKKIRGKENKKIWLADRLNSGKKRFADQFVGKPVKKGDGITFSGAIYEMGLISVMKVDKEWKITLTEKGQKFLSIENPVLDIISSNLNQNTVENIFSKEEVDFIFEKIIPLFPVESDIIHQIMREKVGFVYTSNDIRKMIYEHKLTYLEEILSDEQIVHFKQIYKNDFESTDEEGIFAVLADKHSDIQAAVLIRRLSELGITQLTIQHNESEYTLKVHK